MTKLLLPTAPIFALALFFGCNGAPPAIDNKPPPFDDGFIRLAELEDEDPDDDVVQVSLIASVSSVEIIEGVSHDHFAYNGSIPGPLIRAKKGDTLVVNLKNDLLEGTTIHWHGMRVPNGMDGVPGVTQEVVEPGEDFRYEFQLLDASTFWYHPHFQTLKQVGNGLYGAVLVDDPEEEADLGKETVFAISDVSIFEDGSTQEHPETDEIRAAGREGATLLLNGHPHQRMKVRSGERLRWRVLNMARSRYLELQLKGHEFLRIGSDGGRMESPVREPTTSLVPGERVDLIIEPMGEVGTHLDLVTLPVDRGADAGTAVGPEILLRLEFVEGSPPKNGKLPSLERTIPEFSLADAEEVQIALTMGAVDGKLVMGINDIPWSESNPFQSILGRPQIWNIVNNTAYAHPFHMHGFHFQVLNENGGFASPRSYKDTINVEPRASLRLVPRFDEDRPGMWMFHCHILDHAESGMMGVLNLSDGSNLPDDPDGPDDPDAPESPVYLPGDSAARDYLVELLASGEYLEAPWRSETAEPRAASDIVSPHGDVQVHANETLLLSLENGNGASVNDAGDLEFDAEAPPHTPGSVAIKDLYDGDEVVGHAAILKLEGSSRAAAYYCEGPSARCGSTTEPPVYGEGLAVGCGGCHGGRVYTVEFPSE